MSKKVGKMQFKLLYALTWYQSKKVTATKDTSKMPQKLAPKYGKNKAMSLLKL